ncbi:unnamed protein product [Cylindrotheca closterium]|uniref:Actin-related protein 8 n=1 Tax=Cylindrotheca closterium TaxID=2856 RepID=A0AAD2CQM5_9STRA|nr:unnamed protein product [Cylindrotheca closterium]
MVDETSDSAAKPQAKKRRRSQTSPAGRKKKEDQAQSTTPTIFGDPIRTLIIDNGGFNLKYGWSTDQRPEIIPNITARLKHQFTVLVGDELNQVQNPNSLHANTRSTERGMIVNLGNQTLVWKRMLDKLGVIVPQNSEAAGAFGWSINSRKRTAVADSEQKIPSNTVAVLLLLPPHCPRVLLNQILNVWLTDFGVCRIGFAISSIMAGEEHSKWCTSCTIDLGWSSTLVVPSFKKKPVTHTAIRRMPIGGRHMINMLKYYMSYRQYNLMEQEIIMREVFECLSFVALDFGHEMKIAQDTPAGRRHYDRDFILPDYQTSHRSSTRLPLALQKEIEMQQAGIDNDQEEDDEDDDEDFNDEGSDGSNCSEGDNDVEDNADSEDETEEEKRTRLLRERAERERLRKAQEQEEQALLVSVERFTVPEVLFRPQDAGMQAQLVGLSQAVVQAVEACPEPYHPALYRSVFITGGVSKIPNLKERLEAELRSLVSPDYQVCVASSESPIAQCWIGGQKWIKDKSVAEWSIGAESLVATPDKQRGVYSSLLIQNGGWYI